MLFARMPLIGALARLSMASRHAFVSARTNPSRRSILLPTVPHSIPPDSPILIQEERAIARLARDTHTALAKVQEIFLAEYERLAPHAHIKSFLPLIIGNRVRAILQKKPMPAGPASEL
jgi:hypothetical protein